MESTNPRLMNALANPPIGWNNVPTTGMQERNTAFHPQMPNLTSQPICQRLDWLNQEYREAYMEACVEQNIAWQIALNRKERGMSQAELAKEIETKQSVISRYEDPTYGRHSIEALTKIAHAFKCALSIKFISYSELAVESSKTGKESLLVKTFAQEKNLIKGQAV